ncbi:hypothetical protein C8R45DRAFT_931224 [Mycena sanguinolenta]|nr:hypothetical protein C8R45DRAFT_931224 [Mycena sanguinolenta]
MRGANVVNRTTSAPAPESTFVALGEISRSLASGEYRFNASWYSSSCRKTNIEEVRIQAPFFPLRWPADSVKLQRPLRVSFVERSVESDQTKKMKDGNKKMRQTWRHKTFQPCANSNLWSRRIWDRKRRVRSKWRGFLRTSPLVRIWPDSESAEMAKSSESQVDVSVSMSSREFERAWNAAGKRSQYHQSMRARDVQYCQASVKASRTGKSSWKVESGIHPCSWCSRYAASTQTRLIEVVGICAIVCESSSSALPRSSEGTGKTLTQLRSARKA